MINISELIQLSEAAGAAVPTNIMEKEFSECPEEYKNLSMSESSLYFENQMLRCELEYRDIMDESVNEMIQDMINRKNGIINESATDIKSKLKKIKDFIVKVFTTIRNAIKNFIIKAREALKNNKIADSKSTDVDFTKLKVDIPDSDDIIYNVNIEFKPFNITDPKCPKLLIDEMSITFNLLYNLIENVILDKQSLDNNDIEKLFKSIDDIYNKYKNDIFKIFEDCTKNGQYKKHSKYDEASNSDSLKDKFNAIFDSIEITIKASDYARYVDKPVGEDFTEMFNDTIKKFTGIDYKDMIYNSDKYIDYLDDMLKISSNDEDKLLKLIDKINVSDEELNNSNLQYQALKRIIGIIYSLYRDSISICIEQYRVYMTNRSRFFTTFTNAADTYLSYIKNHMKNE